MASRLEANVAGKARESNELAGTVPAIVQRHRAKRKDRGVTRPAKRKNPAENRPRKRAPSEYNHFVGKQIKEIKSEYPDIIRDMPRKMAFSGAVKLWNARPKSKEKKKKYIGEQGGQTGQRSA